MILIDEIDKSDVDLPNDLLTVLEEGRYRIPELVRMAETENEVQVTVEQSPEPVAVRRGVVQCRAFPVVVMTSNGEREFPPAFLRRCVRIDIDEPRPAELEAIVRAHLGDEALIASGPVIEQFLRARRAGQLATDQLLNAIFLIMQADETGTRTREDLAGLVLRPLAPRG